jgi:hypothetical protein
VKQLALWMCALASGCETGSDPVGSAPDASGDADAAIDAPDAAIPPIPAGASLRLQMETDPAVMIIDAAGGHTVSCSTGSCPSRVPGKHGNGYQFSSHQLRVSYAADLDPSLGYTVSAWVRLDDYPILFACSVCKPWGGVGSDSDSYCMCVNGATMKDYFYSTGPGPLSDDASSATVFPRAAWHHLAMTWDAQTQIKTGYVDGRVVATSTVAISFDTDDLVIGADNLPANYFWTGAIDDVVVYSRALACNELAQLAETTPPCGP